MRNLTVKYFILSLFLVALAGNTFGQKTDWEEDGLQGKVKKYELFSYEFDISDSINHDEFMDKFYQCGFDADRMIRFADSINTEKDRKHYHECVYDSMGQKVEVMLSDGSVIGYQNEYDEYGRLIRRYRKIDDEPQDSAFVAYNDFGNLTEEKYWNWALGYRTIQWMYDSEGRLLDYKHIDSNADTIISHKKFEYNKKGVLHKTEVFESREGCSREYCEYDIRGNVIYKKRDHCDGHLIVKIKTKYKYDKNDSIVKETCRETRWYKMPKYKDVVWQEIDSTGRLVDYSDYIVENNEYKTKSKSVRTISRDEKGVPVEEIYEIIEKDSEPRIVKTRYDELGRVVEEKRINNLLYSGCYISIFRYYENSECLTYYATYNGDDEESVAFSHESMFFYDERGNCIAHIHWMPKTQNSEYYFEVFRYEYYE